jgi:DNA-binding transcriptional LysR family regulator
MLVRQLQYLVAVARNRHFARAAEECHVTQPTLSAGLRKLEEELGLPLVVRGHRFLGLTPEGERVLAWAQRIILDYDSLKQELAGVGPGLSGTLRLGAIPAALAAVPLITMRFCAKHAAVSVQVRSMSSIAIQRGLDELEIDAGLTYLENEPLSHVRRLPLYRERYVFVTRSRGGASRSISWAEAAAHPLCLLTPDMQNRRILDRIFEEAGASPKPRMETNSFTSIWAHVRYGTWSSIVPHTYFRAFGRMDGVRAIPLVDPVRTQAIGLVTSDRDPLPPVAAALIRSVQGLDLESDLGAEPDDPVAV